jgi:hypothetical protein
MLGVWIIHAKISYNVCKAVRKREKVKARRTSRKPYQVVLG